MSKGVVNRRDKFIWDNSFKPDGQNSGSGGGSSYSTEERVVGTWINGKPLYEVTMEILNWPRNSYSTYNFSDAGISDIDEIVSEAGTYIFANNTDQVQYPVVVYGPANFDHYFYRTGAVFYYTYNSLPFKKIIYTIRYTKTTD